MTESTAGRPGPTRRSFLASAAGLGVLGLTGIPRPRGATTATPRGADPHSATPHSAASVQPALTNLQLAGQRIISSYPGLTPPQSLLNDIAAGNTAGVIFFGENISSTTQIAGVVAQLRQAQASS